MKLPTFIAVILPSLTLTLTLATTAPAPAPASSQPTVRLPNSRAIYTGFHIPQFSQDAFHGIPYALKPQRFTPSTLLTPSPGRYDATEFGFSCPAYNSGASGLVFGEDCLSLSIVRPSSSGKSGSYDEKKELLPVMVWIYGGAFYQGSIADQRYNMSYIVRESVDAGHPVITVAVNYRLAGFGFLFSQEVRNSRNMNLGLRDQRVALQWIQKNIKAFGGDPNRVTIWGESAGAYSIGDHLVSYGGASSGLFQQAILESGNAVGPPLNDTRWYQPKYNQIITATGCADASDTLECLRSVPYDIIYKVPEMGHEWYPVADGDMIREWPSAAIREGRFQKMPLLLGQNTDEGTSFAALGQNTDEDIVRMLQCSTRWSFTPHQAKTLLSLYSTDPNVGCPYGTGNRTFEELGKQYKRYASMVGDMMMDGPRRFLASEMAKYEKNVYSYRFDAWSRNDTGRVGVGHFQEVAYVMNNPQFLGTDEQTLGLSKQMARMWTSFAATGNPGGGWERYDGSNPKNLVLRLDKSYMEEDTYRKKAIEWIMGLLR